MIIYDTPELLLKLIIIVIVIISEDIKAGEFYELSSEIIHKYCRGAQKSTGGKYFKYKSARAGEFYGLSFEIIRQHCRGAQKSTGEKYFKYEPYSGKMTRTSVTQYNLDGKFIRSYFIVGYATIGCSNISTHCGYDFI